MLIIPKAYSAEANVRGNVTEVLVTDNDTYGGCMVKLNVSIAGTGLDCPTNNYVSFSCSGDFHSETEAMRLFDVAMMAKAVNQKVNFRISDTQKHNGFCTVVRVQS